MCPTTLLVCGGGGSSCCASRFLERIPDSDKCVTGRRCITWRLRRRQRHSAFCVFTRQLDVADKDPKSTTLQGCLPECRILKPGIIKKSTGPIKAGSHVRRKHKHKYGGPQLSRQNQFSGWSLFIWSKCCYSSQKGIHPVTPSFSLSDFLLSIGVSLVVFLV